MGTIAIFTLVVAEELIARGFELVARTQLAWHFEDSVLLESSVRELVEELAHTKQ